jgi:hypothetical protein
MPGVRPSDIDPGSRKHVLRVVVVATTAASVSACSLKMARIGRALRTYEDVLRLDVALVDSSLN